jgi:hypothetical protein
MSNAYKRWNTDEELLLIKQVSDKLPIKDIAAAHKRSVGAIRARISKINTREPNAYKIWTTEEETLLIKHINDKLPIEDIAKSHERSITAIKDKIINIVLNDPLIIIKNIEI